MLASMLLRKAIVQLNPDSTARSLLDRASRNLTAAGLPYERIAALYDVPSFRATDDHRT
jgi:hypothetical protein